MTNNLDKIWAEANRLASVRVTRARKRAPQGFDPLNLSGGQNLGRIRNVVSGWQGVTPGGTASISFPVGMRVHRINLQCFGIYFSAVSGTALPAVKVSSTSGTIGTGTIAPTISNGQVTGGTIGGTFTGTWAVGDLISFQDPTGYGCVFYVATVSSSLPATVNLTGAGASSGTACPLDPRIFFNWFHEIVNSQVIRDISPASRIGIAINYGYIPQTGTLPLIYTEPWRNFLKEYAGNSWDLTGQNTFQIQAQINSNVQSPAIYGVIEFDGFRNARVCTSDNQAYLGVQPATMTTASGQVVANPQAGQPWPLGAKVPFLDPIAQHESTFNINAGSYTDITTLNFQNPITKIYGVGSTPGRIYRVDLIVDGQLRVQDLAADNYEANAQYNMQTGNKIYAPQNGGGGFGGTSGNQANWPVPSWATTRNNPTTIPNGVLGVNTGTASNPFPWDFVLAFDADGRDWECLRVTGALTLRVYSNLTQTLKVCTESRPGQYSA